LTSDGWNQRGDFVMTREMLMASTGVADIVTVLFVTLLNFLQPGTLMTCFSSEIVCHF